MKLNGRSPYRISARWLNPATNKVHIFKSRNIWYDPTDYLKTEEVAVKLDPANPKKRYWMDVSFLPEEA